MGDEYVINGQKMWITNGGKANWCVLITTPLGVQFYVGFKFMIILEAAACGAPESTSLKHFHLKLNVIMLLKGGLVAGLLYLF